MSSNSSSGIERETCTRRARAQATVSQPTAILPAKLEEKRVYEVDHTKVVPSRLAQVCLPHLRDVIKNAIESIFRHKKERVLMDFFVYCF